MSNVLRLRNHTLDKVFEISEANEGKGSEQNTVTCVKAETLGCVSENNRWEKEKTNATTELLLLQQPGVRFPGSSFYERLLLLNMTPGQTFLAPPTSSKVDIAYAFAFISFFSK
jgi:hypothetical protein